MAEKGTITQYQGPFIPGTSFSFIGYCIIGISISEDDYMLLGSTFNQQSGQIIEKSFRFKINGQQIWMGRTYMYQTQKQIDEQNTTNTIVSFPEGAPPSTKVEVVYCESLR